MNTLSRAARAAAWTAGATLATVCDPPEAGAVRQAAVAELEAHAAGRQTKLVRRDLGHHRVGAGAEIVRARPDQAVPSATSRTARRAGALRG